MSLLLIQLPPGPPGTCAWVRSDDNQTVSTHGLAAPDLLPVSARGTDVVAVLPAAKLSWHQVQLPKGVGPSSNRLRTVLTGLLEDQLLDEPDQLHFAVAPQASANGGTWVAVCRRDWLVAHLQALDAAQHTVGRIVPEVAPQDGPLQLTIVGTVERPLMLALGGGTPGGVQTLPFTQSSMVLLPTQGDSTDADGANKHLLQVWAEPALAELAEQALHQRVALQQHAERMLAASRSNWDLAQMELALSGRARRIKKIKTLAQEVWRAPAWRPLRWGLVLILLANLIGLNVGAWQTRADLARREIAIRSVLTETFPKVPVVDAAVQMTREVALLRQRTGSLSKLDLESMLNALGTVTRANQAAQSIEFSAGNLFAKGVQINATELDQLNQRLSPLGYHLSSEGDGVRLQIQEQP